MLHAVTSRKSSLIVGYNGKVRKEVGRMVFLTYKKHCLLPAIFSFIQLIFFLQHLVSYSLSSSWNAES